MSDVTYAALIILLFFVLLYWMYGMMVTSVVRWSKRPRKNKKGKMVQPKLTFGETVRCYIPLYQVSYMRLWLYGSSTLWNVLCSICLACVVLRGINLFIPINSYVMFVTVILMYTGVLMHILIYGIATAAAVKLYGFSWFTVILSFFIPHFVAYFMRTLIPNKMQSLQKEDVFHEHKSDTYIKQRTDKR